MFFWEAIHKWKEFQTKKEILTEFVQLLKDWTIAYDLSLLWFEEWDSDYNEYSEDEIYIMMAEQYLDNLHNSLSLYTTAERVNYLAWRYLAL